MAAAVIVFIFLIPAFRSVYQGLGYILQAFFSGTFLENIRVSMGLVALITAVYVFFGGYISTAVNSMIQGIIMVGGVVLIVVKVLGAVGGFGEGMEILSSISDKTFGAGALSSIGGPDPFSLVVLVLMTSFGTFGLPQMIAKSKGSRARLRATRHTVFLVGSLIVSAPTSWAASPRVGEPDTSKSSQADTVMRGSLAILSEVMAILVILMLSASMSALAAVVLVSAPHSARRS